MAISRAAAICIDSLFFLTMEARRHRANRNAALMNQIKKNRRV
ncbi:hypothetical protein C7S17_5510 [Burkholderia thailandensis]|nr:hypothetical protein [Burkholderia thailandensis]